MSHSAAWSKEKRRRALLRRKKGLADRAKEKARNEEPWLKEFKEKGPKAIIPVGGEERRCRRHRDRGD